MCGICGFYSKTNIFSEEELKKMALALSHRGPDANGFFFHDAFALAHLRLSIIDLSDAANQPMTSRNGRYVMVYNGEVYNYKEIEKELKIQNNIFCAKTSSDTEIILEAFSQWGIDFVNKLNGMFAIVIYDKEEKSFSLFRDRLGIKPLYYFYNGTHFAFASELKALKQLNFINKTLTLNPIAINEYLHLGYIPEPDTLYKNIYKFPSGSYGILSHKGLEIKRYWNIHDKISENQITDEHEAKNSLKGLLISSVKYRMISDVPFGTFLSGGIDSSLVTAIAQSINAEPIKTFNIRFNESKYDESPYARAVAKYLQTNHTEYTLTEKDALELIPQLPRIYDEPFADSSAIPTLLVSKMARQQVTMTLSGDGGDELFMGYGAYRWAERLDNPFVKTFRAPIGKSLSLLNNRCKRAAHLFEKVQQENMRSHIFSQEQYLFSRAEIKELLHPEFYHDFKLDENPLLKRNLSASEKQSLFDLNYYLKDDLLVKVDRASMHHSLETRVPLLDYRIVEFAYKLHPSLRMKGKTTKYLLKKVLSDYIPESYFNRKKRGFAVPLEKWMQNELKDMVQERLSEERINLNGILNYAEVAKLKTAFYSGKKNYLYNRLWELMVLQNFIS